MTKGNKINNVVFFYDLLILENWKKYKCFNYKTVEVYLDAVGLYCLIGPQTFFTQYLAYLWMQILAQGKKECFVWLCPRSLIDELPIFGNSDGSKMEIPSVLGKAVRFSPLHRKTMQS